MKLLKKSFVFLSVLLILLVGTSFVVPAKADGPSDFGKNVLKSTVQDKKMIPVRVLTKEVIVEKEIFIPEPTETPVNKPIPMSCEDPNEEIINQYVDEVCALYEDIDPYLIRGMIFNESSYNPDAVNFDGTCVGLMQVSTYWHKDRAERLGVTDLTDPFGNILVGVDYVNELYQRCKSFDLTLMLYNMPHDEARELYSKGELTDYVIAVKEKAEEYRNGGA